MPTQRTNTVILPCTGRHGTTLMRQRQYCWKMAQMPTQRTIRTLLPCIGQRGIMDMKQQRYC
ncbi:hypothetical protein GBAR_LOCUS22218 [Geodia barretti]|uniref:Uncharacterized protein n=1 Tax=Geodia barretti TaxID=519541 RepID=A0AA35X6U6_GEOBA|nr:hypothetical protein GBAR_LOCUS22218 [Geodia barretti]